MDLVAALFNVIKVASIGVLVLLTLVFVHELGHYWVAKLCGMHVDSFAVMMGGLRKTDLRSYLPKPLAPSWHVWLTGLFAAALMLVGGVTASEPVFLVGLGLLAIPVPIWIVSRLQALYHMKDGQAFSMLAKAWIGAMLLMAFATRFQGVTTQLVLSLVLAGSFVGLLMVYYYPVSRKADDSPMGAGQLAIPTEDNPAGIVPVQFRPVASFRNKEGTEFSLLALPLGGFAAIKGMHPKDDGSEVRIDKGFYSKSPFARFMTLFAGPFFSIAFGIICLTGTIMSQGIAESSTTTIEALLPGKAGEQAGLKEGDKITAINGQPVATITDMSKIVRFSYDKTDTAIVPKPLEVTFLRGTESQTLTITPDIDAEAAPVLDDEGNETGQTAHQARIGVLGTPIFRPAGLGEALAIAAMQPIDLVKSLASIVVKPSEAKNAIGGPKSLADATSQASERGFLTIVRLAALLSISLGVLNLLPIPPLDGGQMVVALIEMFRGGKRLSLSVQQTVSNIGAVLVVLLMLSAITVDVSRSATKNIEAGQAKKAAPKPEAK